jgi:hypothetical protein
MAAHKSVKFADAKRSPFARSNSNWQSKIKRGAGIHFSLRPSATSMAGDDSSYICQANARAFKFIFSMEPLKDAKQFGRVFHVEASAVVANE